MRAGRRAGRIRHVCDGFDGVGVAGLDQTDGAVEALEGRLASILESQVGRVGETAGDRLGDEDLARAGVGAQTRRHVERGTAEAALDGDRLTGVDPDADVQRQRRIGRVLLRAQRLELERGPHRLRGNGEHAQRLVAAKLEHLAAAGLDGVARQVGEHAREPCGRRVAVLAREPRVSADVRDHERAIDAHASAMSLPGPVAAGSIGPGWQAVQGEASLGRGDARHS